MFPHYKRNWYGKKVPDGWEDLGETGEFLLEDGTIVTKIHSFCGTIISVGKENDTLFHFCPRCMCTLVKTQDSIKRIKRP